MITLFLAAGCGHSVQNAAAPSAPAATVANAPAAPSAPAPAPAFQPYTLLPPPPPAPPVATPRHRVLHLTRLHDHVYLADSARHLYEAGRDTQGHIYPIYRDPATRVTYPLYYDARRDNLYRLARADGGHFYRNYVGEGSTRFYGSDRDYERITPADADRPIVTDSYNTYNYNTYNYDPHYGNGYPSNNGFHPYPVGYRPPPHHSGHNDNWLWAIPVIIGAYLLLQPHHSAPPPVRSGPTTVIVRQNTSINIINRITQAAPIGYRPIASPRPVYVSPPGYAPQPGYASSPVFAAAAVRPHRLIVPVAAALAVPATRAALVRPAARPSSVSLVARPTVPTASPAALRPLVRQAVPARRVRPPLFRRPAAFLARHPFIHHAAPLAPRTVPRPRIERPRVIAPPAPRPVPRRIEAARPRPAVRPQAIVHPRVVRVPPPAVRPPSFTRPRLEPRRVLVPPAPRVEHPAQAPHRPAPPRPAAARPHQESPHQERKRPEAPRRVNKPTAVPKSKRAAKPGPH